MDNAVSLVQAYLRLNGYLTVTEFPVLIRHRQEGTRTLTDLDVLAFRFTHAGPQGRDDEVRALDRALSADPAHADMIIGEVKEGRARLNASALDRKVIEAPPYRVAINTQLLRRQEI